ncbi:hypothetical protein ACFLVC_01055 [Chloroflexota bacterium]
MTETTQPSNEEKKCTVCGITSEGKVLLCAEDKGKQVWVCVGCLPTLVHPKQ